MYLKSVTGLFSVCAVFYYTNRDLRRRQALYSLLVFFIGGVFVLNIDSIKGRVHILNITGKTLARLFPNKSPSYAYNYNHAQIDYFRYSGSNSGAAYLADEGGYALNDFFQMTDIFNA